MERTFFEKEIGKVLVELIDKNKINPKDLKVLGNFNYEEFKNLK